MSDENVRVFIASGEIDAQQVCAFLRASGIDCTMRGEALRKTHGFTLDGLGKVEIFVSAIDEDRAKALLSSAEAGDFRLDAE
jgi:hypothetical protein